MGRITAGEMRDWRKALESRVCADDFGAVTGSDLVCGHKAGPGGEVFPVFVQLTGRREKISAGLRLISPFGWACIAAIIWFLAAMGCGVAAILGLWGLAAVAAWIIALAGFAFALTVKWWW